ncbi:MAG: hypothetical protein DRJ37_02710 [Thermoprotei archaeon]|nr:MAG: hypothetical protein DRJ37_02710 [Thermoprotei archaeon]
MEEHSELSNAQYVKVSLLIGAVCGATALGVISLRSGRYRHQALLRKVLEKCANKPLILIDKARDTRKPSAA